MNSPAASASPPKRVTQVLASGSTLAFRLLARRLPLLVLAVVLFAFAAPAAQASEMFPDVDLANMHWP